MMKIAITTILCLILFSCASTTKVTILGTNEYSLSAIGYQDSVARDNALAGANKYCANRNKKASVTDIRTKSLESNAVGSSSMNSSGVAGIHSSNVVVNLTFACTSPEG